MMLRHIITVLGCLMGVASAAKGSVGAGRHVGWARTPPLAVGALSGFRMGPEPYLLEFHGVQCDFCDVSDGRFMLKYAGCKVSYHPDSYRTST